jgi:NAD(P)-dependent dehydrogenase (short-subunit alcohol dehydrogenase family)
MAPRVWFITGCSSGFGEQLALEALSRGDNVIATARNPSKLDLLKRAGAKVMALDVTAPLKELQASATEAYRFYNRIDVLVNNAGYIMQGSLEELT